MTFNIFVSYSSKDIEEIKLILDSFKNIRDTKIFFADSSLKIGDEISKEIENEIRKSDLFLVFYSINSDSSNYVQQEIGFAKNNVKSTIIIPILLDGTKPTAFINGIKYLDLSNKKKYNSEIKRLYDLIISNVEKKNQNQAITSLGLLLLACLIFFGNKK
ncbi:MAG: toll/interleukin-1 receptor domain-containing protein [Nanoarchaeota archaeon]